ncbi:crossover junction endodeoxyribonuclease RuvC [Patescibacteria group bacterium]|nr:crossover junction endodeoxyribonuclease RuvC [Patescibacteria group bacterium]
MAKIILGLDPGIADTGYGIISYDKAKLVCLAYGSIKTDHKKDLSERLETLDYELKKLIQQYRPELVAVEQLFFNKNVKTALIVGQARGVLLLRIKKSGLKILEFTPGQVKQAVAAYGRASKDQVQKMVKIILGLKSLPQPDDAADALAIAICSSSFK